MCTAFGLVALGFVLGPHRLGDYMTETDFYGAYAQGARLVQRGILDPSRYGVIGPGYETALALVGFAVRDLFVAAELLSVASAITILILWFELLRRRVSAAAGCFAALFVASNAHFLRFAYSAATDTFSIALQALALFLLLGRRPLETPPNAAGAPAPAGGARDGLGRMVAAGLLAALAFLTRYNAVCLVPVGFACILAGESHVRDRAHGATLFAGGFLAPVVPWVLYSLSHGGSFAFQLHHNIAYEVFARARGIPWDDYQRKLQPQFHNLWDVIARDPRAVFGRMLFNVGDHLRLDAKSLLTQPLAAAALIGIPLAQRDGSLRRLWPVWLAAVLLFLTLVPVFYSERYALALLPMYAALAGLAFASPSLALAWRGGRVWLKPLLAAIPLGFAVHASVKVQARVVDQLPTEVLVAARTLKQLARPGDRVIARKGHIAYHAGLEPLPFPFADSLAQLARYARDNHARWLYFSWPEAETRPRLWFLLDTAAVVPGLTPRVVTRPHPAVLYEIGEGFGLLPAWMSNDTAQIYHKLRAELTVDPRNPSLLYNEAVVARALGKLDEARRVLETVVRLRPGDQEALALLGDILLVQNHPDLAEGMFDRLLAADPTNPVGALGRGWSLLMRGRSQEAARAWQPVIDAAQDVGTLGRMIELYASVGDHASEARARARLAQLGGSP